MNVFYLGNYRVYVRDDGSVFQIVENIEGVYFDEFEGGRWISTKK